MARAKEKVSNEKARNDTPARLSIMHVGSRIKPVTYGRNTNTGVLEWLRGLQFAIFNAQKQ